jgi:hypothetical protein
LRCADATAVVEFLEGIGCRSEDVFDVVKRQQSLNQTYLLCLTTLAKAYERSGDTKQAKETLKLAESLARRFEKMVGDNPGHAEYATVKLATSWLYLTTFCTQITEAASSSQANGKLAFLISDSADQSLTYFLCLQRLCVLRT